jgi:hypothetical protein
VRHVLTRISWNVNRRLPRPHPHSHHCNTRQHIPHRTVCQPCHTWTPLPLRAPHGFAKTLFHDRLKRRNALVGEREALGVQSLHRPPPPLLVTLLITHTSLMTIETLTRVHVINSGYSGSGLQGDRAAAANTDRGQHFSAEV